jgi:hypothetical protein
MVQSLLLTISITAVPQLKGAASDCCNSNIVSVGMAEFFHSCLDFQRQTKVRMACFLDTKYFNMNLRQLMLSDKLL